MLKICPFHGSRNFNFTNDTVFNGLSTYRNIMIFLAQSGLEQIYNNISVTYVTVGGISVAATLALCWLQARKMRLSL